MPLKDKPRMTLGVRDAHETEVRRYLEHQVDASFADLLFEGLRDLARLAAAVEAMTVELSSWRADAHR